MVATSESDEIDLARLLYAEWDDGGAHGRRFDRFIFQQLGIKMTRKSKQTDRIADLERQVRSLGAHPCGVTPSSVEQQLQHARTACLGGAESLE